MPPPRFSFHSHAHLQRALHTAGGKSGRIPNGLFWKDVSDVSSFRQHYCTANNDQNKSRAGATARRREQILANLMLRTYTTIGVATAVASQ